jgi:hypothetical protein
MNEYTHEDLDGDMPELPPLDRQGESLSSWNEPPTLDRGHNMNQLGIGGKPRRAKSKSKKCPGCGFTKCTCKSKNGGCPCDGGKTGGGKKRAKSKGKKRSKSKGKK